MQRNICCQGVEWTKPYITDYVILFCSIPIYFNTIQFVVSIEKLLTDKVTRQECLFWAIQQQQQTKSYILKILLIQYCSNTILLIDLQHCLQLPNTTN